MTDQWYCIWPGWRRPGISCPPRKGPDVAAAAVAEVAGAVGQLSPGLIVLSPRTLSAGKSPPTETPPGLQNSTMTTVHFDDLNRMVHCYSLSHVMDFCLTSWTRWTPGWTLGHDGDLPSWTRGRTPDFPDMADFYLTFWTWSIWHPIYPHLTSRTQRTPIWHWGRRGLPPDSRTQCNLTWHPDMKDSHLTLRTQRTPTRLPDTVYSHQHLAHEWLPSDTEDAKDF